ncbi:MAG: cytochrome c3 family protein [Acidobacteria bacterium]|nr:cytochrome c3 family protein [Acidobacteriota bacterium]
MLRGPIWFAAGFAVMLSAGWLVFPRALYQKSSQPIQFSHRTHAEKAGMKCEDCHSLRADGAFTGIPQVDKCAGCHAAPVGSTADEKLLVDRYVTPNREIPWKVYARQPDNAWFPHAYHVKLAKLACEQCHGGHGKTDSLRAYESNRVSGYSRDFWGASLQPATARTGLKMSQCEHCHDEKGVVTGCIDCHK